MLNEKIIGFIYRIDYTGDNPKLKGLSYAGSKKISSKLKWNNYFGSPSKKGCEISIEWKMESKRNPNTFKKSIIKYVYEGESLVQNEIDYLKSVSEDIKKDEKWLNHSIPRLGSFPECEFSPEERKEIFQKRKKTIFEKTGKEYGEFLNLEKRKNTWEKIYGVDHPNKTEDAKKRNASHKKEYFSKMTPEERKLHGKKVLEGSTPESRKIGSIKSAITRSQFSKEKKKEIDNKRKESWKISIENRSEEKRKKFLEHNKYISEYCTKRVYVTLKIVEDNVIKSGFLIDLTKEGFGRTGISNCIKRKLDRPVYCRKIKKHVLVLNHMMISRKDLIMLSSEKQ